MTLVDGEQKAFRFSQVLLLFHISTYKSDKISAVFGFVSYIEKATFIDNFDFVVNYLCLRRLTGDKCDHTFYQDLQADIDIDI